MRKLLVGIIVASILITTGCSRNDVLSDESSMSVCLSSEPDTIDPALNSTADGGTLISHLFSGLAKWSQNDDGIIVVPDCAKSLPDGTLNNDGTVTYVYELQENLYWSDGKKVTADDFVFSWNRAASPELSGDYHHLFDVIKGYDEMWEYEHTAAKNGEEKQIFTNKDAVLSVTADNETTLRVTLKSKVNYWNELLAFPTFFPVREDVVQDESWATKPETFISNGPFSLAEWKHNSIISLKKNDRYHDADTVKLTTLNFYLSDNSNNMLTNYKKGDWLLIDDVPSNEIAALKSEYPTEFYAKGQLGTYYISWNVNADILPSDSLLNGEDAEKANADIRKAISLLIDRNYVSQTIGQAGQTPASSFIAMGLTNPDGTEFYKAAGNSEKYVGYYDVSNEAYESNYNKALSVLKKYYSFDEETQKFINFPSLTYIYNTSDTHKALGEYIQGTLGALGITTELINQEWNTFLNTRKEGEYTFARNGWLADYNDPISFLDMWTSTSGNNDVQFGKGNHKNIKIYDIDLTQFGIDLKVDNGTWKQTYDRLVKEIKNCDDLEIRYKLMHLAEDILMETGCITPIFFYTDIYMLKDTVKGFYSNALGIKYFMYCTVEKE